MRQNFLIPDPTCDLDWGGFRGAIHDIFAANAKRVPNRQCVIETRSSRSPERVFTYRQINQASNQLAHHLIAHGCNVGDVVVIYAYRGVDLVVAYMGALKAGATVSVLDPQYPGERQKVLLGVSRPQFLICIQRAIDEFGHLPSLVSDFITTDLDVKATVPALHLSNNGQLTGGTVKGQDCLAAQAPLMEHDPDVTVGPDSIPTLSYTSGTEGIPKGVQGRHYSLTYYTPWMAERFGLSETDRFTMLSGIAHDPIQRDIFTPLFLGGTLICPPVEVITYGLLAEWMNEHKATVTHLTPALGQILIGGATTQFCSLRRAFFVGDLLTKKDCRKLCDLAPNTRVINLFGSTESQRAVSFFEIPSKAEDPDFLDSLPDIIPVGQGMLNVQLLVVDRQDRNRLCGVGETGELFIRAAGLAEGYRGDDERTKELNRSKFVSNWFVDPAKWIRESEPQDASVGYYKGPRDRLYRTGDLGRMREDGSVECTGRIDTQVKIRGFRIELSEIDISLSQHPYVRDNITVIRRDKNEEQTLVTYFVPETRRWFQHLQSEDDPEVIEQEMTSETMASMLRRFKLLSDDCKKFLAAKVPSYAVPSIFIPLARMPLNPNGKIDKPALPFPDPVDLLSGAERRASSVVANMTDTQKRLAAVWASVLPNRSARMFVPESNFFDEGGHSILAQQMFFRLKSEWKDINLPVSVIFRSQTLHALALEIDRALDPIGLRLDAMPLPGDGESEDESYAADARELLSQLPDRIPQAPTDWDYTATPPTVLLTGATGFLGSYILRELLEGPAKARVIVHIRAGDAAAGLARVESTAAAYGLWSPEWSSMIETVVGDISKPSLGVSEDTWKRLSNSVDLIIHNGAHVNWMLPYSSLRATNVISTLDCIRLCAEGKPKRLCFVSSTSTLDTNYYVQLSRDLKTGVLETDDLQGSRKGLGTGYGQSKWASEYIIRNAGARGLTGAIVRPGYITGDPASGISVTDDFLVRLWKGCLQVGARPDINNTLNAVPVSRVSRIVVAAGLLLPTVTGQSLSVAQVTSHPRLKLNEWIGAMELYGYRTPLVPYRDWCAKVVEYVEDEANEEHALLPLFHFVTGDLPANTIAPEMDDSQATAALELYDKRTSSGAPGGPQAVDIGTIGMYLAYLVAVGFLPAPVQKGEQELPEVDVSRLQAVKDALGGRSAKS
ncbi:large subunit of alpha-aminoadipate reductase [Metarhizium acridum]|nr:large subunit of alpha-aminoadipate reductase [Metarhizium acridum]